MTTPDLAAQARELAEEIRREGTDKDFAPALARLLNRCADALERQAASEGWRDLMRDLVNHIDRNTCTHEETYRGGAIWEICRHCGAKWADDEGGKPEFSDPVYVEAARAMLTSSPPAPTERQAEQAGVGQPEAVAFEMYNPTTGHAIVDYSRQTYVGHLTAEMGYEARPLGYIDTPVRAVKPGDHVPLWQAREALDELESAARGDEPFNHAAAAVVRTALEQMLFVAEPSPPAPTQPERKPPFGGPRTDPFPALTQATQPQTEQAGKPIDDDSDALTIAYLHGFSEGKRAALSRTERRVPRKFAGWLVSNSEGDDEFVNNPTALVGRHYKGRSPLLLEIHETDSGITSDTATGEQQ